MSDYMPTKKQKFFYVFSIILFVILFPLGVILLYKIYTPLVKFLFKIKKTDLFFSMTGAEIFILSGIFILIPVIDILIQLLFNMVLGMKKTFAYYDETKYENPYYYNNRRYSLGSARKDKILAISVLIIAIPFFLLSLSDFAYGNEDFFSYKKYFSFHRENYEWSKIDKIDIYATISSGKYKDFDPKMDVYFGNNKIDLWGGACFDSPDPDTLILFIDRCKKNNPYVSINVNTKFSKQMQDEYSECTDEKKNAIDKVFNYALKKM